jgi:hypothetical protein
MGTKSLANTRKVDPTATAAHQTAPPAESRGNPLAPARLQQKASSLANLRATFTFETRNHCVLDGASPNLAGALLLPKEELLEWSLARAKGITHLLAIVPDEE